MATQGGAEDISTAQAQVKMYIKVDGKYLGKSTVGRRTLVVLPERLANGSRVEEQALPR